jgi:hypothetical protein
VFCHKTRAKHRYCAQKPCAILAKGIIERKFSVRTSLHPFRAPLSALIFAVLCFVFSHIIDITLLKLGLYFLGTFFALGGFIGIAHALAQSPKKERSGIFFNVCMIVASSTLLFSITTLPKLLALISQSMIYSATQ